MWTFWGQQVTFIKSFQSKNTSKTKLSNSCHYHRGACSHPSHIIPAIIVSSNLSTEDNETATRSGSHSSPVSNQNQGFLTKTRLWTNHKKENLSKVQTDLNSKYHSNKIEMGYRCPTTGCLDRQAIRIKDNDRLSTKYPQGTNLKLTYLCPN